MPTPGGSWRRLALLVVALLLALEGRGSAADSPTTETTRLLSLAPNITETLFALGLADQVVGVTDFCEFPEAAKLKPKVGGLFDANLERMLALRPTLALHAPTNRPLEAQLARAGVETLAVPNETVADIRAGTLLMGERLGVPARGRRLVAKIDRQLGEVRALNAGRAPVRVLYVVGHPPGELRDIYAVGTGTFLDELLTVAGARNVMAEAKVAYPLVSREFLIRNPPDVIIESKSGEAWTPAEEEQLRAAWRALLGPGADKARVAFVNDAHITIPGPSIGESAAKLAALIHAAESPSP